jgi:3-mercaptopyruvate sulfurtransferase SseA
MIQKSKTIFVALFILFFSNFFILAIGITEEFEYVSLAELKKLIESGDQRIIIVDTQPGQAYKMGHIKGAINFPWDVDLKAPGFLPYDKMLVIYCDCPHEEDSTDTARQLKEKWGYSQIKLLNGSWSQWQELGYPAEKEIGGKEGAQNALPDFIGAGNLISNPPAQCQGCN